MWGMNWDIVFLIFLVQNIDFKLIDFKKGGRNVDLGRRKVKKKKSKEIVLKILY